jgi:uncharacterized membrane protein YedE/YeeE
MKLLMPLLCGTLFGFGLALSGMTDISKVIGFLDLFGNWDPTLAFVMVGGILVSLPFFQFGLGKIKTPLFGDVFRLPTRTDIDARLIGGAALFGIGWGLVGLCPGPAIASLAYLNIDILYFGVAMTAGMFVADFIDGLLTAKL